jgi:hypothetical protein
MKKFDDFAQALIRDTKNLLDGMRKGQVWIRFYTGPLNVDPKEGDIVVFWYAKHGVDHEIEYQALWDWFWEQAEKIKGFVTAGDHISGDGGTDWMHINLTQTTSKAWAEWSRLMERRWVNDSFMGMIGDTSVFERLQEEREEKALEEFWSEWYSEFDYYVPAKYYENQRFNGMAYDRDFEEWQIDDQTRFDKAVRKMMFDALAAGDIDDEEVGEAFNFSRCAICKEWHFIEDLYLYHGETIHEYHLGEMYKGTML